MGDIKKFPELYIGTPRQTKAYRAGQVIGKGMMIYFMSVGIVVTVQWLWRALF